MRRSSCRCSCESPKGEEIPVAPRVRSARGDKTVVGQRPVVGKKRCARDHDKRALAKAVRLAGHPATLGGIEFAPELVPQ